MPWNSKKYARINWKNRPSVATPLGATLLNKIDVFLNEVDNQLIEFEARKLNIATANSMISNLSIDVKNGIVSAAQLDGTVFTWDLNLEKIPVSFSLSEDGVLTMITDDGTRWTANISELIKDYVFDDSETIAFSKEFKMDEFETKGSYHVTASIKEGSVEGKHLNPDYRADIQSYKNEAQAAASDSEQYAKDSKRWAIGDSQYAGSETDNSKFYYMQSKSYAVGTGNEAREGDEEDNSKYYYEQSRGIFDTLSKGQVIGVKGEEETDYRKGNVSLSAENIGAIARDGDASLATVDFEQAAELANIQSGDSLETAFGKLSKFCASFGDAAFSVIANNLTTTSAGSVLDARQGKILNDKILAYHFVVDLVSFISGQAIYTIDLSNTTDTYHLAIAQAGGTNDTFAASITNADKSAFTIVIRCITNPALTADVWLRLVYLGTQIPI